ncbi:prepilin-type N-terminal cleavage/methylation domain-containing protein [bacterium]|nr:prepilin-type N-terminal cleavage/methylation domain-containing protein [bacterium]
MKGLHRKREEGFSLSELMIATAVALIGFMASYSLLQLGYKYFNLGTDVTQAQQEARMDLETMIKELQETSAGTVWVTDEAVSFASARNDNNEFLTITATENPDKEKPYWQKAVVYFRDAESNILFKYEEAKEDWSTNFNPSLAVGAENLKEIATSVTSIVFQFSGNLLSITIQGENTFGELTTTIQLEQISFESY